jgi:pimeloyl-ACP methyl ester carboxylesterase
MISPPLRLARRLAPPIIAALWLAALASTAGATHHVKPLKPFGHTCSVVQSVRFCPTTDGAAGLTTDGVPSFDGVPLDVDVTLPATGNGPFPTIVMVHGWGGDKTNFESNTTGAAGDGNETWHYNNVYFAQQGYAVVNYTARGWGHSCGGGPSADHSGACANGYVQLDDQRYEARDVQTLLGILVDEHITQPAAIGVTGISYGGGLSMELAYLKNRIRLPNGTFAAWTSPKGTPLSITAAYPRWEWSDLVDALLPNGRFLDFSSSNKTTSPIGITIASYLSGLYALGLNGAYYCGDAPANPCTNSNANLTQQFQQAMAGEPYTAAEQASVKNIRRYHDAYGVPLPTGGPAPLLIQNGFTDDLFPPSQALRAYNQIRAANPSAPVALQLGDLGHSRGANKVGVDHVFQSQAAAFFAHYLQGAGTAPAPGSVEVFRETCPASAPIGAPIQASSWAAIHPKSLTFGGAATRTVTATGDSKDGHPFDPISGTSDSCAAIKPSGSSGTAVYTLKSRGFTLLGLPTVRATIQTTGNYGELDSRLYDVLPGGAERLIARGAYRLLDNQSGRVVFQLHGNAYRFVRGDTVKLELRGNDVNYLRASNDKSFTVRVSNLKVTLPLH